MRSLFDMCIRFPGKNRNNKLIDLSQHIIAWCEQESRSFLRMKIENKLADLLFNSGKFQDALVVLKKLMYELKRKDDKLLIVES